MELQGWILAERDLADHFECDVAVHDYHHEGWYARRRFDPEKGTWNIYVRPGYTLNMSCCFVKKRNGVKEEAPGYRRFESLASAPPAPKRVTPWLKSQLTRTITSNRRSFRRGRKRA